MKVDAYIKMEDSIFLSNLVCRCCGNKVYVLSDAQESICNFCEAFVSMKDKDVVHGNRSVENNLALMQKSASTGKWEAGVASADALAATKNPYFLYGAASFYRFFSDYTYNGVDYTLGGFMYSNAEKRSNEPQINKYNAMALISKSREFLFGALKMINDTQNPEETLLFIKFMANVKLGRKAHAQRALAEINVAAVTDVLKLYANIVSSANSKGRLVEKYLSSGLSYGISNTLYYIAMHAAVQKDIDGAIRILDPLAVKSNMPAALYSSMRLKDIRNASEV